MKFDIDKAKKHINDYHTDTSCPICLNKNFIMMTRIWKLTEFESRDDTLPVVALMCDDCGYTIFFNAIKIGLVDKDEKL